MLKIILENCRRIMTRITVYEPLEIISAFSILTPSIVSCIFMLNPDVHLSTLLAGTGCIIHFPFSFSLHMHKAFSKNALIRTRIYKADVSFIHIHALITGYTWKMNYNYGELLYHSVCILYIVFSKPLYYPQTKSNIDILAAIGCAKSTFGLFFRSITLWTSAIILWIILFTVYKKKIAGLHSSWIMHVMLAGPQFCVLEGLQNYKSY